LSQPRTDERIYMESIRPLALPEERAIIADFFQTEDRVKSIYTVRALVHAIAKDREVSPFIQARLLIASGGIKKEDLAKLWHLIAEQLGK
jgi:hypothetical protein